MTLSTQPYKGARDYFPEDKRIQKHMFKTIRKVVERFGYEEYDAPLLEPTDLYLSKGNEEIINEQTYTFQDRGERSVTIRTEMTPSVSRMVASRRQELAYPLRWYSIPNLMRYERPQKGRLREFWQPNIDIFGVEGVEAEHEIIQIADQILRAFGARSNMYTIRINSRKLIDSLLKSYLGLDNTQVGTLIRLIDRMHKLEHGEFVGRLEAVFSPSQREAHATEKTLEILQAKSINQLPDSIQTHESIDKLKSLLSLLEKSSIRNAEFDITLMRGFDYYTDIVFEIFDNHPENNRAMGGGGRYDGLVGMFGVEPLPTVGFALGEVPLENFLRAHDLLPELHTENELGILLIGDVYADVLPVVHELRRLGVNVSIDITGRKIEKQLKSAIKQGLHYVLFIGEREIAEDRYVLKDLRSGKEESHGIERIVSVVKRRNGDDIVIEDDI